MRQLNIREATKNDAKSIDDLCIQLGYTSNLHRTISALDFIMDDPSHCVLVAEVDDKIVAWIHAFVAIRLESDSFVEIGGLIVDSQYRKQGIGKLLISRVRKWGAARNVKKLRVRCNLIRRETHDFYLQIGFCATKDQKIFDLNIPSDTVTSQ